MEFPVHIKDIDCSEWQKTLKFELLFCSLFPYSDSIWKELGAEVVVTTADITTREGCEEIVAMAMELGPVGGIFNLAGVIKDSLFKKMNEHAFADVVNPKALSTMHFDSVSRGLCPQLDHFVVFSSISCGFGNAGQSNYGFANSISERVVEQRRRDGFPGQAIQWGPVDDVGMMKNALPHGKELPTVFGMIPQKITSCFNSFNDILCSDEVIVTSVVVADKKIALGADQRSFEAMLMAMGFPDIKTVDRNKPILEMGMDSIGGTEIQQTLEREFGIIMSFQELRSKTLNQIEALIKGSKSNMKTLTAAASTPMDEMWKNLHTGRTSDTLIEELKFVEENQQPKMLLIPGMIADMGSMWHELDHTIYVCHHMKYHCVQSFDELIRSIVDEIFDLFKNENSFFLIGYSFGAVIALQICELLEAVGKRGKLVLIDGSPNAIRLNVTESLNTEKPTDEDIQNYIFEEYSRSKYGANELEILRSVFSHTTWEARVDEYVKHMKDMQTKGFVENNFKSLFNRLKMVVNNDFKFNISDKVDVTLIRPGHVSAKIGQDYGLREYCKGDIRIETIPDDHSTVLESHDVLDIIESL